MTFDSFLQDVFNKIIAFLKDFLLNNLGFSQDIVDKIFGAF